MTETPRTISSVRFDAALYERLKAYAKRTHRSVNASIIQAIEEMLDRDPQS